MHKCADVRKKKYLKTFSAVSKTFFDEASSQMTILESLEVVEVDESTEEFQKQMFLIVLLCFSTICFSSAIFWFIQLNFKA